MSIKQQLLDYAMQLIEDRGVAESIVNEAITYGVNRGCDVGDAKEGHAVMITEIRNKCYDHIRLNKEPGQ